MSQSLSPIYDKIARDLVKKYDNRKDFQAQGDKFQFTGTFYTVNLQGAGEIYVSKESDAKYILSDSYRRLLNVSADGVEGELLGLKPEYIYFAEALSGRLFNNANSGEAVKIFVGSGAPEPGAPDIRLSVQFRNYPEADGYRATDIKFKIADATQSSKSEEKSGLNLEDTAEFLKEARSFTEEKAPSQYWSASYEPAINAFIKAIYRIFAAEGRKVDVVEDDAE